MTVGLYKCVCVCVCVCVCEGSHSLKSHLLYLEQRPGYQTNSEHVLNETAGHNILWPVMDKQDHHSAERSKIIIVDILFY